jgi:predicted AlkP superfamily pyrophosphatase or phosphodiesterase
MIVNIKEKSVYAKLAAYYLKAPTMAIVFGNTIHLYKVSKEEFLSNKKWVRHEVAHVIQYKQKGFIRFILSYLMETFNMSYEFNKYEVEARKKETDLRILEGVEFS